MENYNSLPMDEKIEKLQNLFSGNPLLKGWDEKCSGISHIDDYTAIFHVGDDINNCYKYVISPNDGEPLKDNLVDLVLGGIKNHYGCRNIPGVQYIGASNFYNGITGLIGPLEYISGENLKNI